MRSAHRTDERRLVKWWQRPPVSEKRWRRAYSAGC